MRRTQVKSNIFSTTTTTDVLCLVRLEISRLSVRFRTSGLQTPASTVEHPFGTIKLWTGSRHFLTKELKNVRTEMSLNVLAYNLRRMISILGVAESIKAVRDAADQFLWLVVRLSKRVKSGIYYWQQQNQAMITIGRKPLIAN